MICRTRQYEVSKDQQMMYSRNIPSPSQNPRRTHSGQVSSDARRARHDQVLVENPCLHPAVSA